MLGHGDFGSKIQGAVKKSVKELILLRTSVLSLTPQPHARCIVSGISDVYSNRSSYSEEISSRLLGEIRTEMRN